MDIEDMKFYTGNWRMRAYMRKVMDEGISPALEPGALERLHRLLEEEGAMGEEFLSEHRENKALSQSAMLDRIVRQALNLFARKNEEYGNSIARTGVLGAVVAMTGDIARLRQMVLRHPQHGHQDEDNVRDKLLDVLVEAAIGILMLDSEN